MASIDELRNRQSDSLDSLRNRVSEESNGGGQTDERFWKPPFDQESGKGFARIRLLPASPGEDLPWVKVMRHIFQGSSGKTYFENSLTTLGMKDPVSEMNSRLWNTGIDSDKQVAREQKRKTVYFANVLVLDDKGEPENNGKVFLFRFGPQIWQIIESAMYPEFEDEKAINPFDPWEGATLNLKMVGKKIGSNLVPNYEKSYFDAPAALGDDEYIEKIWNQTYPLQPFVARDQFKSYDELKTRLREVLGETVGSGVPVVEGASNAPQENNQPASESSDDGDDDIPWGPSSESEGESAESSDDKGSEDDVDDDLKLFEQFAEGDGD